MIKFRRITDIILGLILAALTIGLSYIGLKEMITEGSGWYDHLDYMYTLLLVLALWLIAYIGLRLSWNSLLLITKTTEITKLSKTIEEGIAQVSHLENQLFLTITPEDEN